MMTNEAVMIQTTHKPGVKEANPHLESFERLERAQLGKCPSWLYPVRKAAISRFAEMGFPQLQDEDWRFTNVAPIVKLPFKPVLEYARDGVYAVDAFTFSKLEASRLVFINGHYSAEYSSILPQPRGVRIASLAEALHSDRALIENHLAGYASGEHNAFTALNTAFFHDGAFVFVPAGTTIERPVHLLFISTGAEAGTTSHPRNLIIAERNSRVTLLENYAGAAAAPYLTNSVTELITGDGANVEHCKFQDENANAFHVAAIHSHLARASQYRFHSIATGARLSRNNIRTALAGPGVDCILNGLYVTKADQLADHHMVVEHAQPNCNSHEYFNGILDGRSRGVFHGRILVRPIAQKTDAKQTNKNLLLSDDAAVDTKPQLEIYADDVKCTHGATVGQLNEESVFYLRARGIGLDTARRILIHAFAAEIIDRIQFDAARHELNDLIWHRLEQNPHVAEPH